MSTPIHPRALPMPPFADLLDIRLVSATREMVVSEMRARPELMNRNGVLHGGAVMALADNTGGTLTFLHLGHDQTTTTMESKTNFFRAVPEGDLLRAESIPLHVGRKTVVVQTSLYRSDGKLAAMVTQTQFTLPEQS